MCGRYPESSAESAWNRHTDDRWQTWAGEKYRFDEELPCYREFELLFRTTKEYSTSGWPITMAEAFPEESRDTSVRNAVRSLPLMPKN